MSDNENHLMEKITDVFLEVEVRPDSMYNLRLLVALHISIDGNGNIPQAVSQTNFHFQSLAELSVQLHPSCEVQTSPQPQEA